MRTTLLWVSHWIFTSQNRAFDAVAFHMTRLYIHPRESRQKDCHITHSMRIWQVHAHNCNIKSNGKYMNDQLKSYGILKLKLIKLIVLINSKLGLKVVYILLCTYSACRTWIQRAPNRDASYHLACMTSL